MATSVSCALGWGFIILTGLASCMQAVHGRFIREIVSQSHANADAFCARAYGTRLATIKTAEAYTEALAVCGTEEPCWIGLNDAIAEGDFRWPDNSTVSYFTNWTTASPDPNPGNNLDCVVLSPSGWSDIACSEWMFSLCDAPSAFNLIEALGLDFDLAQEYCQSTFGSSLATIKSAQDQIVANNLCAGQDCWIGLSDVRTEGNFQWLGDSEPLLFTAWASDQPVNVNGNEDCVQTSVAGWRAVSCLTPKSFLCNNPDFKSLARENTGASLTFPEANAHCKSKYGTHLATLNTTTRNFVANYLCDGCGIGLNDDVTQGEWRWRDGEIEPFPKWELDELIVGPGLNGRCAFSFGWSGWISFDCKSPIQDFMCDVPPNFVLSKPFLSNTAIILLGVVGSILALSALGAFAFVICSCDRKAIGKHATTSATQYSNWMQAMKSPPAAQAPLDNQQVVIVAGNQSSAPTFQQ